MKKRDCKPIEPGTVFTRLTVIKEVKRLGDYRRWYLCQCECGKKHAVRGFQLKNGKIRSCGCLLYQPNCKWTLGGLTRKNGDSHPTYNSWRAMLRRCNDPKYPHFHRYGGRGISVCKRWEDYLLFLMDMGERPKGKTIDRIDNDGNYEPGNCRWATPEQQTFNRG